MSLYQAPHQQKHIKCRQLGLGIMTGQLWRLEKLDTFCLRFQVSLGFFNFCVK